MLKDCIFSSVFVIFFPQFPFSTSSYCMILERFNSIGSCMVIPQRIMFGNLLTANSQSFITRPGEAWWGRAEPPTHLWWTLTWKHNCFSWRRSSADELGETVWLDWASCSTPGVIFCHSPLKISQACRVQKNNWYQTLSWDDISQTFIVSSGVSSLIPSPHWPHEL